LRSIQVNIVKQQRQPHNDFYDVLANPLGTLYLFFTSGVLSSISFSKPSGGPVKRKEGMTPARRELTEYFEKGRQEFTCQTVFIEGTEFERKVWATSIQIPYGETRTYKWLA
jgi:methylated-DNA-[protein]-cysteine S-methyltransferase